MEADGRADVHVGHAVAVGEAEGLFILQIVGHALEAPAGHGVFAGVHHGHTPGLGVAVVHLHAIARHVEGEVRGVQEVVGEVFLDHVAAVTAADHEIVHAVRAVDLHDVPEDGLAPDLHHGLGFEMGFFGNPGAQSPGKDDGFHGVQTLPYI